MGGLSLERDVLTTGQAAKHARVSQRTILKWCNKGMLDCYLIPGSRDRRIYKEKFIQFLHENGMIVDRELGEPYILVLGNYDVSLTGFPTFKPSTLFVAGLYIGDKRPSALVIDAQHVGRTEALEIVGAARSVLTCAILVVLSEDDSIHAPWIVQGADRVFNHGTQSTVIQNNLVDILYPKPRNTNGDLRQSRNGRGLATPAS